MSALCFLDLEMQAVTPLIIGGASFAPELRPPSFRGGMRVWLRALVGGLLGDDLYRTRLVEGATFGSAGHASPVAVRARGAPRSGPLPVNPDDYPGVQYMLWSAFRLRREALLPGERFQMRLQTRPTPPAPAEQWSLDSDEALGMAAASLWLLARLGGVGARIRRGAGGFQIITHPQGWPPGLPSPVIGATTPANLADELADELTQVRQFTGWTPVATLNSPSTFNLLHPDTCELYVLDRSFSSWWEALDAVGVAFKAFRLREPNDYQGIKAILTRGRVVLPTIKRAVFGLPLGFFFSSLYEQLLERGVPQRQARAQASATVSPLFFRVLALPGAGAPRYAEVVLEIEAAESERLFGKGGEEGALRGELIFLDGVPVTPPPIERDVLNPHYAAYYGGKENVPPADYLSPRPVFFLAVGRGSVFSFGVASVNGDQDSAARAVGWLQSALTELGVGAKTAAGYGYWDV